MKNRDGNSILVKLVPNFRNVNAGCFNLLHGNAINGLTVIFFVLFDVTLSLVVATTGEHNGENRNKQKDNSIHGYNF
jgi:hypothetical protein